MDTLRARLRDPRLGPWLIAVAVALTALPAAVGPLWDADLGWMLRAGRALLDTRALPHENAWSFTAPHAPWVFHEWLLGALYAALAAHLGVGALCLVRLAAVAITATGLHRAASPAAHPNVAAAAVAVALVGYGDRFASPRPMGVALAFAAAVLAVSHHPRFRARHAVLLGALAWLWAACHGSYPLAAVLLASSLGEPGARRARLAAFGAMALGASLTPYGLGLHGLVGRYLHAGGDDATAVVHARILEWWPLWRAGLRVASPAQLAGYAALWAASVAMLASGRWRWRGAATALLLAMAWWHNRHLFLAASVGLALVAAPATAWLRLAPKGQGAWRAVAAGMALPVVLGALALGTRSEGQWLDPSRDDEDLTALVRALPEGARVYVGLPFAGWALWVGGPRLRVYWDPRNDCYPAEIVREALDLEDGRATAAEAQRWLAARGAGHAVVVCAGPTARLLTGWAETARRGRLCTLTRAGDGPRR